MTIYRDRYDAGAQLGLALAAWKDRADVRVLGLPRGGVPVAHVVARSLAAPLDVFVVRKLGVPLNPELAMGAVASGGITVLNEALIGHLGITRSQLDDVIARERASVARREHEFRGDRRLPALDGMVVIVVDDGLATGSTMRASVRAIRDQQPARVIVAVPVGAADSCDALAREADDVVCLATPSPFDAVGVWYEDFSETTDEEVRALLKAGQ